MLLCLGLQKAHILPSHDDANAVSEYCICGVDASNFNETTAADKPKIEFFE